jgi:hypothetical protein
VSWDISTLKSPLAQQNCWAFCCRRQFNTVAARGPPKNILPRGRGCRREAGKAPSPSEKFRGTAGKIFCVVARTRDVPKYLAMSGFYRRVKAKCGAGGPTAMAFICFGIGASSTVFGVLVGRLTRFLKVLL